MTPILEVRELSHSEDGMEILKQISFSVQSGRITGVVGPNGSGKSTLLQILSGIRGNGSAVRIEGRPLSEFSQRERAIRVAYIQEDCTSEFPLTAEEAVFLGGYAPGRDLHTPEHLLGVHECMKETGCFELRKRQLEVLSGGERQRVALARAFYQGARVLCLDESFSRLDLHHQVRMAELLRVRAARGQTILLVSHDLNFVAEWAQDLLLIQAGRRVDFGPVDRVLRLDNLKILYPDAKIEIEGTSQKRIYFKSSGE